MSFSCHAPSAFLTHDWGQDELGRDNHETAKKVYHALRGAGLSIWFDEVMMQGCVVDQMAQGIDQSVCVIVFVTQRYIEKVGGSNANDNCKIEFGYATRKKSASKMLPVPIEPRCKNPAAWDGQVSDK